MSKKTKNRLHKPAQRNVYKFKEPITVSKRRSLLSRLRNNRKYAKYNALSDNRFYNPLGKRISRLTDGTKATLTTTLPKQRSSILRDPTKAKISFADPKRTIVCQRRKNRRETLFRRGKVGKGKKVSRIRRRNINSDIKC